MQGASIAFPSMRLEHVIALPAYGAIAAFGCRSCVILDDALVVRQRYLDASRTERFRCALVIPGEAPLLCLAGDDGIIKLIGMLHGRLVGHLRGHTGQIYALRHTGRFLVSCSADRTARIWCLDRMGCVGVCGGLTGHKDHVLALAIHSTGRFMATAGTDTIICQWLIPAAPTHATALPAPGSPEYYFPAAPLCSFTSVHRGAISHLCYFGDILLVLSNASVAAVHCGAACTALARAASITSSDALHPIAAPCAAPSSSAPLLPGTPESFPGTLLVGRIEMYDTCVGIEVHGHTLVAMSSSGDVYLFDLFELAAERRPFLMETRISPVLDFCVLDNALFIVTGQAVHRHPIDFSHFSNTAFPASPLKKIPLAKAHTKSSYTTHIGSSDAFS